MIISQHICKFVLLYVFVVLQETRSDLMLVRFQVLLICINLVAHFLHVSTVIASGRNALGQWERFESLGRGGKPGVGTGERHPLFVYPSAAPVPRCLWRDDCNRHPVVSIDKVKMTF